MSDKKKRSALLLAACIVLLMTAGCGSKNISFCGVWDYPEYNVRLQIFEDDTWEMQDETGAVIAGGYCLIDGETAELYYSFGSPWESEGDDPVMYNVLNFKRKGKLSDGLGYPLVLTDETK
ncbi:MAG: hypothetical protein K6G22_00530 [Lachnospiraceae bacterium]|nr:hypothetical protein [Lachnospiraceae bacterium]